MQPELRKKVSIQNLRPYWIFGAMDEAASYRFITHYEADKPFGNSSHEMTEALAIAVNEEIVRLVNRWPGALDSITSMTIPSQSGHGVAFQLLQLSMRNLGGLN